MAYYPRDVGGAVLKECRRRRLSDRTAKTYLYCIERFLKDINKPIQYISKRDVRLFLEKLDEKHLSGSSLNTYHMAIRFLFIDILDKKMWLNIKYSKTPKRIQRFLDIDEMKRFLNNAGNWKHRLMLEVMFGSGLRVSELVNLKICDLKLEKGYGFVRNGKGGKDRIFVIHPIVSDKIRNLIEMEKILEEDYLFKSLRGKKYNIRTIQAIVKDTARKAKIGNWKEIHPHTLRHSFASSVAKDYSIMEVQAALGHKSPETSMVYVHSSSPKFIGIKSPVSHIYCEKY